MDETLFFPRFTRDLVLGDYQYPGEPNGRILVLGSPCIINWLVERERQGLVTVTRSFYITVIPVTDTVFPLFILTSKIMNLGKIIFFGNDF